VLHKESGRSRLFAPQHSPPAPAGFTGGPTASRFLCRRRGAGRCTMGLSATCDRVGLPWAGGRGQDAGCLPGRGETPMPPLPRPLLAVAAGVAVLLAACRPVPPEATAPPA